MTDQAIKEVASNVVETLARIEESFRLAKLELLKKESELFRPLYAKREKVTSAIPRFWSTVLSIEDELAPFIKEGEADLLKSCTTFRIERLEDPRDFSLSIRFSENAYLQSESCDLLKLFKFDGGRLTSTKVDITWKDGKDLVRAAEAEERLSFFSLFQFVGTSDDGDEMDLDEDDPQLILEDMAMLLADEVYPHALSYFTDALAPPETPADSPFLGAAKATNGSQNGHANGAETPHLALESMTTSFLDQQDVVQSNRSAATTAPTANQGKSHQLQNVDGIEQYSESVSTRLPAALIKHREESIVAFQDERMMITLNQAQFLTFLTRTVAPSPRVLEIGTFTGFSALCFAHAGAESVVTLERDEALASFAKLGVHAAGQSDVVRVLVGDAHETLRGKRDELREPFDLVFIDAEKTGYRAYLDAVLARGLLRAGTGVVVVDNTLRRGCVASGVCPPRLPSTESPRERASADGFEAGVAAVRAFNAHVASHDALESVLLPVYDGLTLIRQRRE